MAAIINVRSIASLATSRDGVPWTKRGPILKKRDDAKQVKAAFLAILSRKPTANEQASWSATDKSVESLAYALLNTKHFLFIQ